MMAELDNVRARASTLLVDLRNRGPNGTAQLKPRPEDVAKVFTADLVESVVAHYAPLWANPIEITARPDQTELSISVSLSQDLRHPSHFPGGYKNIAAHLVPDRVWVAWKYLPPGERLGMAYDGLVWIEDHFAWFPKPWRMLAKASDPFYVD